MISMWFINLSSSFLLQIFFPTPSFKLVTDLHVITFFFLLFPGKDDGLYFGVVCEYGGHSPLGGTWSPSELSMIDRGHCAYAKHSQWLRCRRISNWAHINGRANYKVDACKLIGVWRVANEPPCSENDIPMSMRSADLGKKVCSGPTAWTRIRRFSLGSRKPRLMDDSHFVDWENNIGKHERQLMKMVIQPPHPITLNFKPTISKLWYCFPDTVSGFRGPLLNIVRSYRF